ncbi:TPA: hypothetical protein EYG59_14015 [Candidatus Poribacteria bacterium]|nr:hypothetical protein [Candidatus Poribacteria bacterium]
MPTKGMERPNGARSRAVNANFCIWDHENNTLRSDLFQDLGWPDDGVVQHYAAVGWLTLIENVGFIPFSIAQFSL